CTSCGQCVATCPTGALRPKDTPGKIARAVETTCPYCGVGCGIELKVRDDGRLAIMADDVPANHSSLGMLCVKGRFATGFVHARDRVTRPMVKRDGRWHEVGWDEALDAAAEGLARHHGHFGALASAKATNEDGYLVQKFCRVVMATNDVDHCTRLCHSPSVEAMLASMGSGATSNSYQDYEEAGCLMVVGADASANHPVIAVRFRRAVSRGARHIAQAARWYAKPHLFQARGATPPSELPRGSCLIWGMGITQHVNGIHNAHALLNLSLVAGQMGFPGSGISPLRGQNNVQGCG